MTLSAGGPSGFAGWSGACTTPGACTLTVGSGTIQATALFTSQKTCSPDGVCWERPLPQGNQLHGVWGASAQDIWAVGVHGTILRQIGPYWVKVDTGAENSLSGVWGSGSEDVWAGGVNTLLHFDGTSLKNVTDPSMTNGTILSLWGVSAPADPFHPQKSATEVLWGVGYLNNSSSLPGASWRWQDGKFTLIPVPVKNPLSCVWGSGPDDVWAVTIPNDYTSTQILHWDGTGSWSVMPTGLPSGMVLPEVWGRGLNDVWFAGEFEPANSTTVTSVVVHYDGNRFTRYLLPDNVVLIALWGDTKGRLWAAGDQGRVYVLTLDGSGQLHSQRVPSPSFSEVRGDGAVLSLWGSGPDDVVAVGFGGIIMRWNGAYLVPESSFAVHGLNAVVGNGADIWAFGDRGTILRRDDGNWTPVQNPLGQNLAGAFYGGPEDIWTVGDNGLALHWDGALFADLSVGDNKPLWAVFRPPGGDVWAVGGMGEQLDANNNIIPAYGTLVRWQMVAGSWITTTYSASHPIVSIWGAAPNDIWAVGGNSVTTFSPPPNPPKVTIYPAILHWDGTAWSTVNLDPGYLLSGIWGSSAKDIWAVGGTPPCLGGPGNGVILHYDGSSWGPPLFLSNCLLSISGTDQDHVWASGFGGVLVRKNGTTWQPIDSGTGNGLLSVWAKGPAEFFVVGVDGTVLHASP